MSSNYHDVLVLNRDWAPINIVSWGTGISLLFQEKAQALDRDMVPYKYEAWKVFSASPNSRDYTRVVATNCYIAIPEIIVVYNKQLPEIEAKYTRQNLFTRDKNTCAYCGVVHEVRNLTIDHIIPRCRGGKTEWNNVVTCCKTCNQIKADKPLHLCGLTLKYKPHKPRWESPLSNVLPKRVKCKSWLFFMKKVDISNI